MKRKEKLEIIKKQRIRNFIEFLSHIEFYSGCWIWSGRGPYGRIKLSDGRIMVASRFSYAMKSGPLKKGYHVHHICTNTMCVKPNHLIEMSPKEHIKLHIELSRCQS